MSMLSLAALLSVSFCLSLAADITHYDIPGPSACGPLINPKTQMLAAISKVRWTTANPNVDPLCKLCVTVKYNGKVVKVPVKDKCDSCAFYDVDLSVPAFLKLSPLGPGRLKNAVTGLGAC